MVDDTGEAPMSRVRIRSLSYDGRTQLDVHMAQLNLFRQSYKEPDIEGFVIIWSENFFAML